MKLLVVITNYRVADLTIECLRSIAAEIDSVPDSHVAVCENGTGDDSATRIQKAIVDNGWSSWCTLTAVSTNLGFTGGNNLILRTALQAHDPPDYVLLLNADTIVRPSAFKALVDFMDAHPGAGITGGAHEAPDGTPGHSAFRFHTPLSEFEGHLKLGLVSRLLKNWTVLLPTTDQPSEVDWVSGAAMLVRHEVFRDIGVLDEGYYTHFEDIDFCFNAHRAGWAVWYVPASLIMHIAGQSTGLTIKNPKRLPSYYFEARRRYFLKNHGAVYAAFADAGLITGLALWRLRVALTGREDGNPPYLLRDSIRHSVFLSGFRLRDVQNPALVQRLANS
jgi:N-acetylglucosaminyl-diphospho-decaprenol L-rhamnosyltransferase